MMISRTPESDALLRKLLVEHGYALKEEFESAAQAAGPTGDILTALQVQGVLNDTQAQEVARLYTEYVGHPQPPMAAGPAPAASPSPLSLVEYLQAQRAVSDETLAKARRLQAKHPEMSLLKVLVKMRALDVDTAKALSRAYKAASAGRAVHPHPHPGPGPAVPMMYGQPAPNGYGAYGAGHPAPFDPHAHSHYPHGMQVPGSFGYGAPYDLRQLASSHRLMAIWFRNEIVGAFVLLLLLLLFSGEAPERMPMLLALPLVALTMFVSISGIIALVGYFMTAAAIRELPLYIVLFIASVFLTIISIGPIVYLVALIVLHYSASNKLKSYGVPVGKFGVVAKADIP